jgi:hypothetical protein
MGASLLESATWGLALLALVVAFAGPVWVLEEGRMEPGRVAVLVDGSRSMSVLEDGTPRSDAVKGKLAEIASQVGSPDVYHFGDELAVGPPDHFDLPGTDLEQALDALSERVAGERLAAVVVISDGLDRGLLRKRFEKEEGALPPDAPGPLTRDPGRRARPGRRPVRARRGCRWLRVHPRPVFGACADPGARVRRPHRAGHTHP